MAINVYLTLFKKYNASQLKALEWKYHLMCYGCPFLVAFVYIFVDTNTNGKIYGSAVVSFFDTNNVGFGLSINSVPAVVLDLERVGLPPHCNVLWPSMVRGVDFRCDMPRTLNNMIGFASSPHSRSTLWPAEKYSQNAISSVLSLRRLQSPWHSIATWVIPPDIRSQMSTK